MIIFLKFYDILHQVKLNDDFWLKLKSEILKDIRLDIENKIDIKLVKITEAYA
ncbi:hypothetical protein CPIN17260_0618 [Campylobacter pinnipediorum subsp. pinnipediorum]|uniref:hypothetical protein n=1 Tax=Campylobacter pinnipediorum TaxID=1965231 RepID=UPI0009C2853A|nr:hypothetical protein [Campylobacter pinnipediorum]AQW80931.1 hypothetical protein CPIN17260_0618 [Campylobacter pinnipediorum subsp. pinnipediorum]AQW84234.1 hypothetical protein CPIN17262_0537 [Campylobacter pinnipediorum subsp. pinnipediorum]